MTDVERSHRLREAAIEAEYRSGKVEASAAKARSHVLVRVVRVSFGVLVVLVGVAMIPLPGPGALMIGAGLAILARDVAWADRAMRCFRKKMPGIPEDGKIPRSTLITAALLGVAGLTIGLWAISL